MYFTNTSAIFSTTLAVVSTALSRAYVPQLNPLGTNLSELYRIHIASLYFFSVKGNNLKITVQIETFAVVDRRISVVTQGSTLLITFLDQKLICAELIFPDKAIIFNLSTYDRVTLES